MIRLETISELRARHARNVAFVDSIRDKRSGWASYRPEDVPEDARMSNDERSALEVYDWLMAPPERYFLYITEDKATGRLSATTWTGDVLGAVTRGCAYRDNFGGTRVPITVRGINGTLYHGTYFKSAGDYARIKRAKRQPSARGVETRP